MNNIQIDPKYIFSSYDYLVFSIYTLSDLGNSSNLIG